MLLLKKVKSKSPVGLYHNIITSGEANLVEKLVISNRSSY